MFIYCLNNPIGSKDSDGFAPERALTEGGNAGGGPIILSPNGLKVVAQGLGYTALGIAERLSEQMTESVIYRSHLRTFMKLAEKCNERYASQATKNPLSNEVVLGRYNLNGVSYINVAKNRGATYFQLDNWDDVAKVVGNRNMWSINEKFLDQQWSAGKDFLLSHNPWEATTLGSYYEKEILHLIDLGAKDFIQVSQKLWEVVK